MLLYDSAVSGNCYKVRLLLAQLSLSFERREVDVIDRSNRAARVDHGLSRPPRKSAQR
jgi:glutathione S-transferase